MSAYTDFWGASNWGFAFGSPGSYYTLGYHIGQDMFTHDALGAAASVEIPALVGGTVVFVGSGSQIGHYVIVQVGNLFHTYCHLKPGTMPAVGTKVVTGQIIARNGDRSDFLGTATGPHLHFVVSTSKWTASNPVASQVVDPRPIIRGNFGSFAGGDYELIIEPEEDPMTYTIRRDPGGKGQYVQSLITGIEVPIQNTDHRDLLDRAKDRAKDGEERYGEQGQVVAGYLRLINPPANVDMVALTNAVAHANDDDTVQLLAAIGRITPGSPAETAKAVQSILAGDFEKIDAGLSRVPAATAGEIAARLGG